MKIAYITAGAAGMFCGSCMRDNTLVAAMHRLGHDALLVPTYTPVTLDEPDQSGRRVFLGGVNVYLQEKSWLFRHTPRWFDWLLDRPWLLRWASRFASQSKYEDLGGLTISMLKGHEGHQRKEVDLLVDFLKSEVKPDVVVLTNVLLSGIIPALKVSLNVPIVATLQGDDLFLDALRPADRQACLELIRHNTSSVSGLIATSHFYADHMAGYLGIDRRRITVIPAGIDLKGHGTANPATTGTTTRATNVVTIGFFARIAPEKGFHHFIDSYIEWRTRPANAVRSLSPNAPNVKLKASGWFGEQHRNYFNGQLEKLRQVGLAHDFEYVPSPDHASKVKFLQSLDLLCVPSTYKEPKGLFVLEAWANGVPVVLPDHGCFSELVQSTGGGLLVPHGNLAAMADAWNELIHNPDRRRSLGEAGRSAVRERYSAEAMAKTTLDYLGSVRN
ncbi:MAG: glycosyltransferase family 4 protein [Gemmataceae bacterium]